MSKTCVVQECRNLTEQAPVSTTIDHSSLFWPFMPKSIGQKENANKTSFPPSLLRSASLDRIRQFPAYLCRQGSSGLLLWLYNSRTAFTKTLSSAHSQLRGLFLALTVYLAIGLVFVQFAVCTAVLSVAFTSLPVGFIFMVACIAVMTLLAMKTITHEKHSPHLS